MTVQTHIDERMIASVWERQAFFPSALTSLGLRVVFRGVPSDAGGPDYQDVILSFRERQLLTGDVEFHVKASDWYRHGHHRNDKYNGVILHVVWTDDGAESCRQDGTVIPVLALDGDTRELPERVATEIDADLQRNPCVATFAALPTDRLMREVATLGRRRLAGRAQRAASDLTLEDADQLMYRGLLEGLGYASNRRAFGQLADAVPYAWLQSVPASQRLASVLDAARLGPAAPLSPPAHVGPDVWRLARLRPANHPILRLTGLVRLLEALGPHLADALAQVVCDARRPVDLRRALMVRDDHATFIGAGRADELAVSVVLPLVMALDDSRACAAQLFDRYPSPPANRWTRHMLQLFESAGHSRLSVRSAVDHQGLHFLYHEFCRVGNRERCSLCQITRGTV